MAFIRKRAGKYGGNNQLIETYRDGGRVRQRIIANLGPYATVADAVSGWPEYIAEIEKLLAPWKAAKEMADRERSAIGRPARPNTVVHFKMGRQNVRPRYKTICAKVTHYEQRIERERQNLQRLRAALP